MCGASLWAFYAAPLAPHTEEEDRKTREDGDANLQNIRDLTRLDGRAFGNPTWGNGTLIKIQVQDLGKAKFIYAGTEKQNWNSPAPKLVVPKGQEPKRVPPENSIRPPRGR